MSGREHFSRTFGQCNEDISQADPIKSRPKGAANKQEFQREDAPGLSSFSADPRLRGRSDRGEVLVHPRLPLGLRAGGGGRLVAIEGEARRQIDLAPPPPLKSLDGRPIPGSKSARMLPPGEAARRVR